MLWLEHSLSEHTQAAYKKDVELFADWLTKHRQMVLIECSAVELQEYLAFKVSSGVKPSSSARSLSSLKRFYRYLLREALVDVDPSNNIESPRIGRKLPGTLSESDVNLLLSAPDRTTALGMRDFSMIDLMYSSGLRVSELVALKSYQYHPNRGYVRVMGKGAKERLVPVAETTIEALDRYLADARIELLKGNLQEEVLFPSLRATQMTRQTFWHRIKYYANQVGVDSNLSPHTLRHAFATHLVNNGADLRVVQLLLGHSNLSTTQIYTHVAQQRMQVLHTEHHPRS